MTYSPKVAATKHKAGLILAIAFAVLAISLFEPLMSWVLILTLCSVVVRSSLYFGWYPHPPDNRTINLLAVLSVLALGWFGLQQGLLLSMINLLVTACSLKLMIMRSQKDYLQLFLSVVFLAGCGYIFEQGLAFVILYTLLVIAFFTSLALQYASNQSVKHQLVKLSLLSAQALPITVILFLVFPQLPPLWKMPTSGGSTTGISDTVRPGDIANLSQSADLAFRVRFESDTPTPVERYWRGLVLEHFDGEEWTVSDMRKRVRRQYRIMDREFTLRTTGDSWNYRVFAEATRQRWLFTLDAPLPGSASTHPKVWQTRTYAFEAEQPLMGAMAYDVASYPDTTLNQTSNRIDREINLQQPENGNPRTREWIASLRVLYPKDSDLINAIMAHFSRQAFSYTLNPPLMQTDGIDAFLFDEQKGFCAHYASAMTFSLRLAGIPARMVTGYQGGEMLDDRVMSIYQYDAHAWVEAWFDRRGWVRFDPTGVVAPNRLEMGLEDALSQEDTFLADEPLSLRRFQHIALFAALRDAFNRMDYLWSQWVLGFDGKQQQDLIKQLLGAVTVEKMIYLMLTVLFVIASILAAIFLPQLRKPKQDPLIACYLSIAQWLEKQTGIPRNNQAALEFEQALAVKLTPGSQRELKQITQLFVRSEYSPRDKKSVKTTLKRMREHFKRLKKQT